MKKKMHIGFCTLLSLLLLFRAVPAVTAADEGAGATATETAQLTALLESAECEVPMEIANTENDVLLWAEDVWLPGLSEAMLLALTVSGEARLYAASATENAFTAAIPGDAEQPSGTDGTMLLQIYYDNADGETITLTEKSCRILTSAYSDYTVSVPEADYTYLGEAIEPAVTVTSGDGVLPADAYTVAYENNIHAGYAAVIATIETETEDAEARTYFYISPTLLEVIPEDQSMRAGNALPTLTYSTRGFIGSDTFLAEPEIFAEATGAQTGTFAIKARGGYAGPDYVMEMYAGELTVRSRSTGRPTQGGASLVQKDDTTVAEPNVSDAVPSFLAENGWLTYQENQAETDAKGSEISEAIHALVSGNETDNDSVKNVAFISAAGDKGLSADFSGADFSALAQDLDAVHFVTDGAMLSFPGGSAQSSVLGKADTISVSLRQTAGGTAEVTLLVDGEAATAEAGGALAFLTLTGNGEDAGKGTVIMQVSADGTEAPMVDSAVAETDLVTAPLTGGGTFYVRDNSISFPDVPSNDQTKDIIDFLSARGIIYGMETGVFAGESTATMAQAVTMLWRLAGSPQAHTSSPSERTWYSNAYAWADQHGIISGRAGDSFNPHTTLTPSRFIDTLMNFHQYMQPGVSIDLENASSQGDSNMRRDDLATEMMAYTKNNILVQSVQAMLAQANTVPQGILKLLR